MRLNCRVQSDLRCGVAGPVRTPQPTLTRTSGLDPARPGILGQIQRLNPCAGGSFHLSSSRRGVGSASLTVKTKQIQVGLGAREACCLAPRGTGGPSRALKPMRTLFLAVVFSFVVKCCLLKLRQDTYSCGLVSFMPEPSVRQKMKGPSMLQQ